MLKSSTENLNLGALPLKIDAGVAEPRVLLIDQRLLPHQIDYFDATTLDDMCFAIKEMVVRGAPSIGVAAAFGLALEGRRLARATGGGSQFLDRLSGAKSRLAQTRPTAVNLVWALEQIYRRAEILVGEQSVSLGDDLISHAQEIFDDTILANKRLADYGSELIENNSTIITHCNAGSLATCGWGTALGVIRSAHFAGKRPTVFVDETRPREQGAKLTMWELHQDNIPCTLICDSMSGHVMKTRKIDLVVVGADRIAGNGDTANKIGTYNLAVLADFHRVPFYIAAPISTIDPHIASGDEIPIEERDQDEILKVAGALNTVSGATAYNPAFDVTPARLIQGIITECGVLTPPYEHSIAMALSKSASKPA